MEVPGHAGPLLLLRGERGAGRAAPLRLESLEHPPKGPLEPGHLLGAGLAIRRRAQVGPRARKVGSLHLVHEALQGAKTPLQHDHVDEDREGHREPQDEGELGLLREVEVRVAGDPGGHHGGDDQQQVRDQYLREEVLAVHVHP